MKELENILIMASKSLVTTKPRESFSFSAVSKLISLISQRLELSSALHQ